MTGKHTNCLKRQARLRRMVTRQETFLVELTHRFANALMVLATVSAAKARHARHAETRTALLGVHHQIMAVAAVHRVLQVPAADARPVALGPYLSRLCADLATSAAEETPPVTTAVQAGNATVSPAQAFTLGLVVTELVINALKHAFPAEQSDRRVTVTYARKSNGWQLAVADNGIGQSDGAAGSAAPGLGTSIVEALGRQLRAQIQVEIGAGRRTILTCAACRTARGAGDSRPGSAGRRGPVPAAAPGPRAQSRSRRTQPCLTSPQSANRPQDSGRTA